jgi:hypothetical protein
MTDPIVKNGGAAYVPPDLLNDASQIQDNKDYIDVVLTDLNLDTEYKMQFAWVYEDKTISDYSDVFSVTTLAEETLKRPQFLESDLTTQLNALIVNWSGLDYLGNVYPKNFSRVDIYVKGGTFGNDYVIAGSFEKAGKQTIIAQEGTYYVKLRAVSKLGGVSDFSTEWSADTSNPGEIIEPPTLPIGLTASTTAFGITINWGGAYQSDNPFSGFKTIAIYATTNSSLGASTTTAFPSSSIVANLTVSQIPNKINVGIDNLKQALGLSTSTQVYAAQVYFYYLAFNKNDEPYKVSGNTTYTRINSTALFATKANLIDLENGLISIENLVAGNGKFTSWLRTGTAGGARIELNGGASFRNTGESHDVLPGLAVYATGATPIFRADLSGTVSFGTYTPADLDLLKNKADEASSTAASKAKVFRQATVPTALAKDDIWINTVATSTAAEPSANPPVPAYEGKNTIYVSSAAGKAYWVVSKDLDIATVLARSGGFDLNGNINRGIQIPIPNGVAAGSIYSVKNSYTDTTAGWFLGWDGISVNSSPVIHIGNANNWFKWTGSAIDVRGSFTTTGTQAGLLGGSTNLTTTLSAGKLSLSSDQTTGFMDWANAAVLGVSSTDSKTTISPAGISVSHTGLSTGLYISYVPGGGYATINMSGTSAPILRWLNYQGTERTTNLMLGDIANRPLVVTDQGLQYLGAQNYYTSASSATMAAATWGVDGDLAFSTNAN